MGAVLPDRKFAVLAMTAKTAIAVALVILPIPVLPAVYIGVNFWLAQVAESSSNPNQNAIYTGGIILLLAILLAGASVICGLLLLFLGKKR